MAGSDKDVKLAARLLKCKVTEVERVQRDADGGLQVWHHGTYKHFTSDRLNLLTTIDLSDGVDDAEATLAAHTLRARMIVEDEAPDPVRKSRGKNKAV